MPGSYGDSYGAVQSAELSKEQMRQAAFENAMRNLLASAAQAQQGLQAMGQMIQRKKESADNLDYSNRALTQRGDERAADYVNRHAENLARIRERGETSNSRELSVALTPLAKTIQAGDVDATDALSVFKDKVDPAVYTALEKQREGNRQNAERTLNFGAGILNNAIMLKSRIAKNAAVQKQIGNSSGFSLLPWPLRGGRNPEAPRIFSEIEKENRALNLKLGELAPQAAAILKDESITQHFVPEKTTGRIMVKLPWQKAAQTEATASTGDRSLNVAPTQTTNGVVPDAIRAKRKQFAMQLEQEQPDMPPEAIMQAAREAFPF